MRDGMRRRRLVRCCADGVWWRGERIISVIRFYDTARISRWQRLPHPAGWAPQCCSAHATLQTAPRHEPSKVPIVLVARIAAALGLPCAIAACRTAINLAACKTLGIIQGAPLSSRYFATLQPAELTKLVPTALRSL